MCPQSQMSGANACGMSKGEIRLAVSQYKHSAPGEHQHKTRRPSRPVDMDMQSLYSQILSWEELDKIDREKIRKSEQLSQEDKVKPKWTV